MSAFNVKNLAQLWVLFFLFTANKLTAEDVVNEEGDKKGTKPLRIHVYNSENSERNSERDKKFDINVQTPLPAQSRDGIDAAQQALDKKFNYITFSKQDSLYGTEDTIKSILEVSDKLAKQKPATIINVGYISLKGGGNMPMLATHKKGKEFNLKNIYSDGAGNYIGKNGTKDTPGYSQEKTLEMLKAFIDRDPQNINVIMCDDEGIRKALQAYMVEKTGHSAHILPSRGGPLYVGFKK
jgi:hypothetical protein